MTRLLAFALVALAATAQAQSPAYLDHATLTRELRTLTNGSRSARMTSLGSTIGGREIWVVEIANPGGKPVTDRPGVLVVGNLEGDHRAFVRFEHIHKIIARAQKQRTMLFHFHVIVRSRRQVPRAVLGNRHIGLARAEGKRGQNEWRHQRLFFRLSTKRFAQASRDHRRVRLRGATHLANLDRPGAFSLAIRRFVEGLPEPDPGPGDGSADGRDEASVLDLADPPCPF
jgi:hypothetical protein